jgi:hypothetical protein
MPVANTRAASTRLHGCHHGAGEGHVVHAAVARVAAAAARVPGGELLAGQLAVAIGEGHDEAGLVRLLLQRVMRIVRHELGVPAAAVQGQHEWRGLGRVQRGGHMHQHLAALDLELLQRGRRAVAALQELKLPRSARRCSMRALSRSRRLSWAWLAGLAGSRQARLSVSSQARMGQPPPPRAR